MRRLFFTLFCLSIGSPFCGAAEPSPSKEPVTVKVFSLPRQMDPEYRVIERFRELHPEIKLTSSTALSIAGRGMDAAPLMSIAGGTSPDIIYVNFRQSDTYISQGFLQPLDEYVARMSPEEFKQRVPAPVLPVIHREGPGGKHYWAMPYGAVAVVMAYRRDLFAAAGLDPDRAPRTWDELREYSRKLADPLRGIYALGFGSGPDASWCMFSYLSSAGAEAVKQSPNGEWRATFDSDEAVMAYSFVDELQKEKITRDGRTGNITYRGGDLWQKWSDGKLAMTFTYLFPGRMADFNPQLIGMAPVPKGPTGKSSAEVNCLMMGLFAGQKDQRVRDAAWEYMRFIDSEEARRIYTQAMVEMGAARMLSPKWLRKFGYPQLAALSPPGLEEIYEQALNDGTPEPYGRNCQFVYTMMTKPMDEIYFTDFSGMTAEQRKTKIKEYLTTAVNEANEKMIGIVTEPVRKKRNATAWVVAAAVGCSFGLLLYKIFGWMSLNRPPPPEQPSAYKDRMALMLLGPSLLLILTWQYYPLLRGSLMAFQNYNVMGGSPWVGINNFADVIFEQRFWLSLKNAAYFCVLWMVMGFLPPMLLAIMLNEIQLGKILYRVLFYLPAVVSGVVILFMWRAIYDPSPSGILNRIIGAAGIPAQQWLDSPQIAMICVVFPLAWANLGPGCIIYLAALKGVPEELYEAADIDGASFFDKVRYIVFPYMKPLLVINAVGSIIFGFKSGDAVLAMTGGGPNLATHVVGYEIFERSFLFLKFGHGTAMAWILGVLLLAFTAYQLKILNKVEFRTAAR